MTFHPTATSTEPICYMHKADARNFHSALIFETYSWCPIRHQVRSRQEIRYIKDISCRTHSMRQNPLLSTDWQPWNECSLIPGKLNQLSVSVTHVGHLDPEEHVHECGSHHVNYLDWGGYTALLLSRFFTVPSRRTVICFPCCWDIQNTKCTSDLTHSQLPSPDILFG